MDDLDVAADVVTGARPPTAGLRTRQSKVGSVAPAEDRRQPVRVGEHERRAGQQHDPRDRHRAPAPRRRSSRRPSAPSAPPSTTGSRRRRRTSAASAPSSSRGRTGRGGDRARTPPPSAALVVAQQERAGVAAHLQAAVLQRAELERAGQRQRAAGDQPLVAAAATACGRRSRGPSCRRRTRATPNAVQTSA